MRDFTRSVDGMGPRLHGMGPRQASSANRGVREGAGRARERWGGYGGAQGRVGEAVSGRAYGTTLVVRMRGPSEEAE